MQHIKIRITLIFLLLTLSGCAKQVDEVVINQNSTVIAFWDSLTTGFGVSPEHSYPSVLEEYNQVPDAEILPDLLGEPSIKSDKVHLNVAGYHAMALAISQNIWVK